MVNQYYVVSCPFLKGDLLNTGLTVVVMMAGVVGSRGQRHLQQGPLAVAMLGMSQDTSPENFENGSFRGLRFQIF